MTSQQTTGCLYNSISLDLPTLTVIIPVYNEIHTIRALIDQVLQTPSVNEILIVDDCSTDGTREWLMSADLPDHVRVFMHDQNRGKGMAIRTAIHKATQEYTIIQDADLEYNPADYTLLLQVAHFQNTPVVYGSRFMNPHNRHSHQRFYWGGRSVTLVTNVLFRQRLTDEPTCYKLFKTSFLKRIPLNCERFEFCPEVTAKVAMSGIKIMEIPIRYMPRKLSEGKKIGFIDGLEAIYTLVRYRFTPFRLASL
ncbi:glycosyltransferase family 2 protein [Fibrella sp. USSR17]